MECHLVNGINRYLQTKTTAIFSQKLYFLYCYITGSLPDSPLSKRVVAPVNVIEKNNIEKTETNRSDQILNGGEAKFPILV